MRLTSSCPNCDKSIHMMSYSKSKSAFQKEVGEEIELFCEKCKTKSPISSESFTAQRSSAMNYGVVLLTLIVVTLSIFMLRYSLSSISEYKVPYAALTIPIVGTVSLIWMSFNARKKVKFFNKN